jgi:hypothetical protein
VSIFKAFCLLCTRFYIIVLKKKLLARMGEGRMGLYRAAYDSIIAVITISGTRGERY